MQPEARWIATSGETGAFRLDLEEALAVLSRTPRVLRALLADLPDRLVHGEHADAVPFEPFDRFAQEGESRGKSLDRLLDEFERMRDRSLDALRALARGGLDGTRPGRHPELGAVTLGQLIATWVAHDLGHIRQIARAMAKQYADGVGPWRTYLPGLSE